MKKITKKQALEQMQEYVQLSKGDTEGVHGDADDLLCEILKQLGWNKVVEEYEKVEKWYA